MPSPDAWDYATFSVPMENVEALGECLTALLPWKPLGRRPHELTFAVDSHHLGMVSFKGSTAASDVARIARRTRMQNPELDKAFVDVDLEEPTLHECTGFLVDGVQQWEARLAALQQAQKDRPEWQVKVLKVERPAATRSPSGYHAWVRIGLLGPFRNTLDMQCQG